MSGQIPKWWVYSLMIVQLASGTTTTIVAKVQDMLKSQGQSFHHPYFQTASLFVGRLMCGIVFLLEKYFSKKPGISLISTQTQATNTGLEARLGPYVFVLPGVMNVLASTLVMVGLSLTSASVYQMLNGMSVAVVAFYSVIFRKRKFFKHQIVGVVLLLVGILIVGVGSIITTNSSSPDPTLGAILVITAQLFYGGIYVLEEKFFDDIYVPPLEAVGVEAVSGLTCLLLLLPVLYFIPCYDTDICSGDGHIEDSLYALKQLKSNHLLMFLFFALIFGTSFNSWSGTSVTKYASALASSTIDTTRPLPVWFICLAVGWEEFIWMQLIGFLLLAFGSFLYNEVIIVPWFGLKEAVLAHQEVERKRKRLLSEKDVLTDDQDSIGKAILPD